MKKIVSFLSVVLALLFLTGCAGTLSRKKTHRTYKITEAHYPDGTVKVLGKEPVGVQVDPQSTSFATPGYSDAGSYGDPTNGAQHYAEAPQLPPPQAPAPYYGPSYASYSQPQPAPYYGRSPGYGVSPIAYRPSQPPAMSMRYGGALRPGAWQASSQQRPFVRYGSPYGRRR